MLVAAAFISFSSSIYLSHTLCPLTPVINQQTHIWKLCSPTMAQPTARHEGDQGGEEQTAVSQTPLSGSSIHSASVHACALGPQRCGPPEDTEVRTRTRETLGGRVSGGSRGPASPHQPTHPWRWRKLSGFKKSGPDTPLPPPHPPLPISRLLQQSVRRLTARCTSVYPNSKI